MDTTPDDTNPITKRHSAVKLILISLAIVGLVAVPVALAQTEGNDLHEDFEDGDLNVEHENWGNWKGDAVSNGHFQPQSGTVIEGSQTVEYPGVDGTVAITERDVNTTAVDEVSATIMINGTNSGDSFGDSFVFSLRNHEGSNIQRVGEVAFTTDDSSEILYGSGGSKTTLIPDLQDKTEYTIRFHSFNFSNHTLTVEATGGGDSASEKVDFFTQTDSFQEIRFLWDNDQSGDTTSWVDDINVYTEDRYNISGTVTDETNSAVRGVTVAAVESGSTVRTVETDNQGNYELQDLENGTYTVETRAPGYINESETVTVDGSNEVQDFQLVSRSAALFLDTRKFLEHGERAGYTVTTTIVNSSGTHRKDVTDVSVVSSGNVSVLSVDQVNEEIVATSNVKVNAKSYVTVEYDHPDLGTLTVQKNVTVANRTVNNLEILPPWTRLTAALDGGTDDNPNDRTVLVIIIATAIAAATAYIATSFAGIGALTMVVLAAWVLGHVDDGVVIACVLVSSFVGLNLAGNVDYTVRKGSGP